MHPKASRNRGKVPGLLFETILCVGRKKIVEVKVGYTKTEGKFLEDDLRN